MRDFLDSVRKQFLIERIQLDQTEAWAITDGVLQHATGGFFSVVGIKSHTTGSTDTTEQAMLYQPQSAATGLLWFQGDDAQRWLLLQARAEPGNSGVAQYGPSIQSTQANSFGLHGGHPAPYVKHFLQYHRAITSLHHDSEQLDLGGRYFCKTKRLALMEVDSQFEPAPGFIWVSERDVLAHLHTSFFFNTDLRSLLTIFGLNVSEASGQAPSLLHSAALRRSLAAPMREALLGQVCAGLAAGSAPSQLLRLDQLAHWTVSQDGIFENTAAPRYGIEFFRVELQGREVRSWCQPLIRSASPGKVLLYCRSVEGVLEVGLQLASEIGLKPRTCLHPSYLRYPGDPQPDPADPGLLLCETQESDEGGRFFEDVSSYQIRWLDARQPEGPQLTWLRLSELRWFLNRSNFCSIQLRVALSHLLACTFEGA